ncbi:MAG: DUF167 domain-containing protein [Gemmatimonadetes bacterium]|nr:DUF167 domain-containing protein [Gemmatimonadota bacterium]
MALDCRDVPGGVRFAVRVRPRASRTAVEGVHDGALAVRLTAPPVEGAANAALVEAIAGWLGVGRRAVSIVRGDTGRRKIVEVSGVTAADLSACVSQITAGGG